MVCKVLQSDAEALDRLSITNIKCERLSRFPNRLATFLEQQAELRKATEHVVAGHGEELRTLTSQLDRINGKLWDLEDEVRSCSSVGFPSVARDIFDGNDERAAIKAKINTLTGSDLPDEKLRARELQADSPSDKKTPQDVQKPLFVLSHMGLGDMLAFAGAVVQLCARRSRVVLACKKEYSETAMRLFADLHNLQLMLIEGDPYEQGKTALDSLAQHGYDVMPLGYHSGRDWRDPSVSWLTSLYRQAEVPERHRHDSFPEIVPDLDSTSPESQTMQRCLDKAGVEAGKDYVFVHDDVSRGFEITYEGELPVVRPDKQPPPHQSLFDYASVLHNAAEIHVIDSSFGHLADLLKPSCPVFMHTYARSGPTEARQLFGSSPTRWTFVD